MKTVCATDAAPRRVSTKFNIPHNRAVFKAKYHFLIICKYFHEVITLYDENNFNFYESDVVQIRLRVIVRSRTKAMEFSF
jgi:hypothetical protein